MKRFVRFASGASIILASGLVAATMTGAQSSSSVVGSSVTVVGNGNTVISATTTSSQSVTATGSQLIVPSSAGSVTVTSTSSSATSSAVTASSSLVSSPVISGSISAVAQPMQAVSVTGACPVVTNFMKAGVANSSADVLKLQTFLRDVEKMNVTVNGVYDDATVQAVTAFQTKYKNDILGPWSATIPSGMVYITTAKKINQIACGQQLSLDAKEISVLTDFIAKRDQGVTGASAGPVSGASGGSVTVAGTAATQSSGSAVPGTSSVTGTSTSSDEASDDEESGPIEVSADASLATRFWTYVANWFR